jgi:hypothetical protein
MEIRHLAHALEHVLDALEGGQLTTRYARLAAALEMAPGREAAAAVAVERAALYAALRENDPPLPDITLEQIGAHALLGEPVITRLNGAFVEHYMHPRAVVAVVRDLAQQTAALEQHSRELLEGLTPLLRAEAERAPVLSGEIIPAETAGKRSPGALWRQVRELLAANRPIPVLLSSRALTLAPVLSSRLTMRQIGAAIPLVVAAAIRAIELYDQFQAARRAALPPQDNRPAPRAPASAPAVRQAASPPSPAPLFNAPRPGRVISTSRHTILETVIRIEE